MGAAKGKAKARELTSWDSEAGAQAVIAEAQRFAAWAMEKDGQVHPTLLVIARKNPQTGEVFEQPGLVLVAMAAFFSGDATTDASSSKDAAAREIARIASESDAIATAFVIEAWMLITDNEELRRKYVENYREGMLATAPERQEIVMVTIEHLVIGNVMMTAPILRDTPEAKPRLGEWKRNGGLAGDGAKGRFAGLTFEEVGQ